MASGSAKELLGELLRARTLRFLSRDKFKEFAARIDDIRRMLWSLARRSGESIRSRKASREERNESRAPDESKGG